MPTPTPDILFSDAVRKTQAALDSRKMIAGLEARNHWQKELSEEQARFIESRDSFYLGTASLAGRPYIQHRGGPPGFIRTESATSLWFPEFGGNRQYITVGNLSENTQAFIFFMDYPNRRRLKLWGRAMVHGVEEFPLETLPLPDTGRVERIIHFSIEALDENCRLHILPRYTEKEHLHELQQAREEITRLQARIRQLEGKTNG
jgi:predicted pyridoxine 5'-phosphate oxidase superfamily flavin-nucleotide-binding protein